MCVTLRWSSGGRQSTGPIQLILFCKDICSRFEDCQPSGPLETALEVLTVIGVVLSLIGIIATIVTLLLFK